MKIKKVFENNSVYEKVEPQFKSLPDNRDVAEPGDTCYAVWFPDETWYKFEVEMLYDPNETDLKDNDMGLGFSTKEAFSSDDGVYDIGLAYHAFILK